MSRTSEEYERLRRQSELLESITGSVLNRVGLSTGMSCLDLGCGPGEVMHLMAQRVGPTSISAKKPWCTVSHIMVTSLRSKWAVGAIRRGTFSTRFRNVWHGRDALPRDPRQHVR